MPVPAVLPSNFGFTSGIQVYFWTQRDLGKAWGKPGTGTSRLYAAFRSIFAASRWPCDEKPSPPLIRLGRAVRDFTLSASSPNDSATNPPLPNIFPHDICGARFISHPSERGLSPNPARRRAKTPRVGVSPPCGQPPRLLPAKAPHGPTSRALARQAGRFKPSDR